MARAGRRDSLYREREAVRRRRDWLEALTGERVPVCGHAIGGYASRRAVNACKRRDRRIGLLDEHEGIERDMGPRIAPSSEVVELLPEDQALTFEIVRFEGPFASTQPQQAGKVNNDWWKVFYRVSGGDWDGQQLSDTFDDYIGGANKTRKLAEAFLQGRVEDYLEEDGTFDFEQLIGRKARAMVGMKMDGIHQKIDKWLPPQTRQPQRQPAAAAR